MSRVELLQQQALQLAPQEFFRFREWFLEYEWDAWDREIESGGESGKLDAMARKALEDHATDRTTPL